MIYRGLFYSIKPCGLVTGFTRGKKRCLRWGVSDKNHRAPRFQGQYSQVVNPSDDKWKISKVFAISVPQNIIERWKFQRPMYYLVAENEGVAEHFLDDHFYKILKNSAGLAKRTLGVGMSKVATASGTGRVSAGAAKTARVRKASNKYSDARVWMNGAEFGVRMDSNLCYALEAVKGGSAAIDFKVRKAMNKVAGYINRMLNGVVDPSNRRMLTPFRELVGKTSA